MVRVILIGSNGRMGQVLTSLIDAREGMAVTAGIDLNTKSENYPVFNSLQDFNGKADVIIDFSHPDTISGYLPEAVKRKLPVVIATTGLSDKIITMINEASEKIPVFISANMSLGINLLQQLISKAAMVLGNEFEVEIVEKHHKMKKDSPSGTALMLADSINKVKGNKFRKVCGREGTDCLRQSDEIGIHAVRGGTIVGEHDVYFTGTDEVIKIGHIAYSRNVFATGAIAAAEFLYKCKPGIYDMQDLISSSV